MFFIHFFYLKCYNCFMEIFKIIDDNNKLIADVSKKIISLSDQYWIDVPDDRNALLALLFVLAVDADKCSSDNR